MAQSMARWVNFWNDHAPAEAGLEQHGGQVRGGVGVRDRAADRAPVPDLRVTDLPRRVREQRHFAGQDVGVLHVVVSGQGADRDVGAFVVDVRQVVQTAEVDDHLGCGQPQLHQRQQRVTAGQELRVVAVFGRQAHRLLDRACPLVAECGRDHADTSAGASAAARAARTMLW
jgi:hypothetical protein